MTTDLDQRLRAALHAVPREAPPAGLAATALTRARRHRRRAVTGVIALVAVLAAAAVTVPALVLHRAPSAQTAGPALGRFVVAGYASRDPRTATIGSGRYQLYQPSATGYRTVPGRAAVPSPDGWTVALVSDQGKVGLVPADRLLDPRAVRWIPAHAPITDAVWSPDSRRLLAPEHTQVRNTDGSVSRTALVVDAATLAPREIAVTPGLWNPPRGRLVFGPRGDGFATMDSGGILSMSGDTGRRSVLTVPPLDLPDQAFSPSGNLLAGDEDGRTTVVDLSSGGLLGSVDGEVSGWYDEDHLVVAIGRSVRVVDYRSGKVLAERELAAPGRLLTGVWLAPVRGAAPPGAVVL